MIILFIYDYFAEVRTMRWALLALMFVDILIFVILFRFIYVFNLIQKINSQPRKLWVDLLNIRDAVFAEVTREQMTIEDCVKMQYVAERIDRLVKMFKLVITDKNNKYINSLSERLFTFSNLVSRNFIKIGNEEKILISEIEKYNALMRRKFIEKITSLRIQSKNPNVLKHKYFIIQNFRTEIVILFELSVKNGLKVWDIYFEHAGTTNINPSILITNVIDFVKKEKQKEKQIIVNVSNNLVNGNDNALFDRVNNSTIDLNQSK